MPPSKLPDNNPEEYMFVHVRVCLMGTLICFKKCSKYLTIAFTDKRDFTSFYKVTL